MVLGMQLYAQRPLANQAVGVESSLASFCTIFFIPLLVWIGAALVFTLEGSHLRRVVILTALPIAHNVLLFSTRFKLDTTVI